MSNPPPTFSFANLLNGTYGVVTPEEVERVRREQLGAVEVTLSDSESFSIVDDDESDARDEHDVSQTASATPDTTVDGVFVTFEVQDYLEMSHEELLSAFKSMVKPFQFGTVLCPSFHKDHFISSISLAKLLLLAAPSSNHELKCFEDLVASVYKKDKDIFVSETDTSQIDISLNAVPGHCFEPVHPSSGFEPPPLCKKCDMILYQCPCFDFNELRKTCAEKTFSDDYVIEGLDGVIDNETLLSNLGPFLLPVHCSYSKTVSPEIIDYPGLARPTDRVDVHLVQAVCDSTLPTHINYDDSYHQVFVDSADFSTDMEHVKLRQSDLIAKIPDGGHMLPVLNTGSGHKRVGTTKEVLTAIKKRNADVPELGDSVNLSRLSKAVADCFRISYMNADALAKSNFLNVVGNFHAYMQKWQSSGLSYDDLPDLHSENLQFYDHMIKSDVKPVVTDTLNVDRPIPATITFHKKAITSQFSPLFISLFERFQRCLRARVIIPVGKISSLEMADFSVLNKHCLEIDLSKFDKSQGEFHLLIQEHILNDLGCPAHITKWWCDFHRFSYIKDKRAGVGMPISFQRRTGDAFTYFGNTIVTMAEFAWCYDTNQFDRLLFSGDDSLAFSQLPPVGDPTKFTTLFNMEAKVMEPSVPYICSKFLLSDEFGNTFSVPDPLREIQRLGTKKIPFSEDDSFLYAHFMSFVDRLKFMDRMSQSCIDQLSIFFELKYKKSGGEAALVLGAFKKYTANFNAYKGLYYSDRQQCDLVNTFRISDFQVIRRPVRKSNKNGRKSRSGDPPSPSISQNAAGEASSTESSRFESTPEGSQESLRGGTLKSLVLKEPTISRGGPRGMVT